MPKRFYLEPPLAPQSIEKYLRMLKGDRLGLDIETTGLDPTKGSILLMQISDGKLTLILHGSLLQSIQNLLRGLLSGNYLIVGHNLSFEHKWIRHHLGLRLTRLFDTQWAHQGLTCGHGAFEQRGLGAVTNYWLGRERPEKKELQMSFVGVEDPEHWEPSDAQIDYAAVDAEDVLEIMDAMLPKIKDRGIGRALKLRFGMVPIVGDLELYGAPVNKEAYAADIETAKQLREQVEREVVDQLTPPVLEWRVEEYDKKFGVWKKWKDEYDAAQAEHALEVYEQAYIPHTHVKRCATKGCSSTDGDVRNWINAENRKWKEEHPAPPKPRLEQGPINLNSRDQVLNALWRLGYNFKSTRAAEFEEYAEFMETEGGEDPIIAPFITYKRLQKMVSAFGDTILDKMVWSEEEDMWVIKPDWNLMVSTWRMSCRGPNLQQVPKPVKVADIVIDLRKHFAPPEGRGLLIGRLDFSNIEMRIAADLSGDAQLIADFEANLDFHGRVLATKLGMDYDRVLELKKAGDPDINAQRDLMKPKNFGTIYGAWDEEHIQFFSATYPQLWEWLQKTGYEGLNARYSRGADGSRKDWVLRPEPPKWTWVDKQRVQSEEWLEWRKARNHIIRQAKNMPIQATSAAITMAAAISCDCLIREYWRRNRMWNIVHDELDFLMHEPQHMKFMGDMKLAAEHAGQQFSRRVPIIAEINVGKYWGK